MIYVVFIGIGLSLFAFIFMLAGHFNPLARSDMDYNYQTGIPIGNIFADIGKGPFDSDQQMKKFSSYNELKGFLQDVRAYFAKVYQERNYGSSSDLYFGQSVAPAQGSGTPMLSSPFSGFFGPSMYAANTQSESMQLTAADPSAAFREAGTVNNDFSGALATNCQRCVLNLAIAFAAELDSSFHIQHHLYHSQIYGDQVIVL